jgi:hypothetical protein
VRTAVAVAAVAADVKVRRVSGTSARVSVGISALSDARPPTSRVVTTSMSKDRDGAMTQIETGTKF